MKAFILPLFLFFSLMSISQNYQRDSIFNLLSSENDISKKSILYARLSKIYSGSEIDSSLYYGDKGYKLAKSIDFKLGLAENASALAGAYVIKNNLERAKNNYVIAREFYVNIDSTFRFTQSSMRLGNIYLAQNNPIEALKLYQECLTISKQNNYKSLSPHLYNNIGLVFKAIEEFDDAKKNFNNAYNLFIENNDEQNSVYPLYNISQIESILGNDQEAINGYLNLITYHLKTENWVSLAAIYNSISEIYFRQNDLQRAQEYLEMALNAMEDKSDKFNTGPSSLYQADIYTNASQIYISVGLIDRGKKHAYKGINLGFKNTYLLSVFKNADVLAKIYESEKKLDSSLAYYKIYTEYINKYNYESDGKQLTKLKMQNEFDSILKQNEIDRIYKEASYKNKELKYIAVTALAVLTAIILVLLYLNTKNKNAKLKLKEENLILEKKKLNQDLDYKKKELASNMMYLMEKNEFISSISKKLIELKPDAKKDNKELLQQIINEIRQNSSTKMWEEFEVRFKEVHSEFYKQLHKVHSDLTLNEVKICAFLRLNMSTKEISAITHQSLKSINMARFRLRKKLNIERDENLISYLKSL